MPPKFYHSAQQEYTAAKKSAVIIDRSKIGQLKISGSDHLDLLHRMTTNEIRNLKPGQSQLNVFTNEKGRIVDRVLMMKNEDGMRLLTSPGNATKIHDWIQKYTFIEDVQLEILSDVSALAVYGPKAAAVLNSLFRADVNHLPSGHFLEPNWQSNPLQIVGVDELAVPGFLVQGKSNILNELRDLLIEKDKGFDLEPMGEDAYTILRIEAGWPIYGKDYDETINPHEAAMLPYINFDKGCYIGQEVVARLDTYEKVQKHLMGVLLDGDAQPYEKDPIFINDQEVGYLTSVAHSFDLGKNIALGYVRTKAIGEKVSVTIKCEHGSINGELVKLPFQT